MSLPRHAKRFSIGTAAAVLALAATASLAQPYPTKPIRFISPFAAGGGNDIMARLLGQKLSEAWGQQVIVDNRPGANTIIAMQILASSPPDGYTIFMASTTLTINASLYAKLPYDTVKDFTPIVLAARAPLVIVVNPSLPVKTVQDLIALARRKPGELAYGSSGTGNSTHLVVEMFKAAAGGIEMTHVAYKGTGIALIDVMGGQIPLAFSGILPALPHVRTGKLRALAVTTARRSPAVAEIPTIAESGLAGFEATEWFGVIGPARIPRPVVERISGGIGKVVQLPDIVERLQHDGAIPVGGTPDQFADLIQRELPRWAQAVKTSGARADY